MTHYKFMTRSELAVHAGVSRRTLFRWLAMPEHTDALTQLGMVKNKKLLSPRVVKYICESFGIMLYDVK